MPTTPEIDGGYVRLDCIVVVDHKVYTRAHHRYGNILVTNKITAFWHFTRVCVCD